MNNVTDTEDAQNRIARIKRELRLNVDSPSMHIRKAYSECEKALIDVCFKFDVLNDLKEEAREKLAE